MTTDLFINSSTKIRQRKYVVRTFDAIFKSKFMSHAFVCVLAITSLNKGVFASDKQSETSVTKTLVPLENRSATQVFLHTVGRGILLPELYGHIQIRILDPIAHRDFTVSWGIYDYRSPRFFWDFYQGTGLYLISFLSSSATERYYTIESRPVWEDEFSLSERQKNQLIDFLDEIRITGNDSYKYHIYADNCSTRIRDLINELTHDSLRLARSDRSDLVSVRSIMRKHQSALPLSDWILDVVGSGEIDREISSWDAMFVPGELRKSLLDFLNPETGERMIQPRRVVHEAEEPWAHPEVVFYIEIALCFLLTLFCWQSTSDRTSGNRILSLLHSLRSVVRYSAAYLSALLGIILICNETIGGLQYLKNNWNLMVFLPVDFLLVHIERLKKYATLSPTFRKILNLFLIMRLALPVVLLTLWVSGIISQDLSRTLLLQGIPFGVWAWRMLLLSKN